MPAPEAIHELVAKFDQHRKEYQTHKNETELRREFLDPFLVALGWDVFNKQGYAERIKDVIHEDSLEVEGTTKAPDYAFRVGERPSSLWKPKSHLSIFKIHPAFQLRRYTWSAKLPVGILTDFEELAIYECRTKPKEG